MEEVNWARIMNRFHPMMILMQSGQYQHETDEQIAEDAMVNAIYEGGSRPQIVEADSDIATYGVELEFLVVQCPKFHLSRRRILKDPHPTDPRWCSSTMEEWEMRRAKRVIARQRRRAEEARNGGRPNPQRHERKLKRGHDEEEDDEDEDDMELDSDYDDDGDVEMADLKEGKRRKRPRTVLKLPPVEGRGGEYEEEDEASGDTQSTEDLDHDADSHVSDFEGWSHPQFFRRNYYTRAKMTQVLRDRGLTVIKWPDDNCGEFEGQHQLVLHNTIDGSEPSDDEREEDFPNSSRLQDFETNHQWNGEESADMNALSAVEKWEEDWVTYHRQRGLKLYRTRIDDIEDAVLFNTHIRGWPPATARNLPRLRDVFRRRLLRMRWREKQDWESLRNRAQDPLHVDVPNLRRQYKAWSVVCDTSVDGNGMVLSRYHVPAHMETNDPFRDYRWFGAEVVSPVLALHDERARQALRDACGGLRDKLRIHKPMEVSSGLHVHLGHTKGWLLPQLKRLAVLWYLTEETILHFHRKDRGLDRDWCAKIGDKSKLYLALNHPNRHTRAVNDSNPDHIKMLFEAEAIKNIPIHRLTWDQQLMVYYIWQYKSIDELNDGLGEHDGIRTAIKWRVRGKYSSLEKPELTGGRYQPGTVEVRIMQGTLDADHINNWVSFLAHIMHVVRDLSNVEFRGLLEAWLVEPTRAKLLEVLRLPESLRRYWMDPKRRDVSNEWWQYPDKDKVDWGQPFMVPGHRATHGSQWDD